MGYQSSVHTLVVVTAVFNLYHQSLDSETDVWIPKRSNIKQTTERFAIYREIKLLRALIYMLSMYIVLISH